MPRRQDRDDPLWAVRVGPGGWATIEQHGRGPDGRIEQFRIEHFLVRVQADERGRYRLRELHLFPTDEPVTAERLRAVRVAALEQLLNLPEERALIEERLNETQRGRLLELDIDSFINQFSLPQPRDSEAAAQESARIVGLSPPRGRGYPDDFYERVADAYRNALRRESGRRPVVAIATEANVPRSTAARWVKEARRRGLLGQAPAPGKAGE
jgi:hypothetical protein